MWTRPETSFNSALETLQSCRALQNARLISACGWKKKKGIPLLIYAMTVTNRPIAINFDKNLKQNEAQSARAESTHKGGNQRSKYVTQAQQRRPESPTVTLTWHTCKSKVQRPKRNPDDVPLVEFMYLVFTRMPDESYLRRPRSLSLYLCYVFRALINSLVCWLCH